MTTKIAMAMIPPCRDSVTQHLNTSHYIGHVPYSNPPPLTQSESRARSNARHSICALTLLPRVVFMREARRDVELSDLVLERLDGKRIVTDDEVEFESRESTKVTAEHVLAPARIKNTETRAEDTRSEQVLQPSTFAFPPSVYFFPPISWLCGWNLVMVGRESGFGKQLRSWSPTVDSIA